MTKNQINKICLRFSEYVSKRKINVENGNGVIVYIRERDVVFINLNKNIPDIESLYIIQYESSERDEVLPGILDGNLNNLDFKYIYIDSQVCTFHLYHKGFVLNSRQVLTRNDNDIPEKCPFCDNHILFTDNYELYGKTYGYERGSHMVYMRTNCKASVGTHPFTNIPLGPLSDLETKELRQKAHDLFDELWKK